MFVPIILGSDKTTTSVGTGQSEYYPLYIAIGNTQNALRRAHRNAVALLAFLVIAKSALFFFFYYYLIRLILADKKNSKSLLFRKFH